MIYLACSGALEMEWIWNMSYHKNVMSLKNMSLPNEKIYTDAKKYTKLAT